MKLKPKEYQVLQLRFMDDHFLTLEAIGMAMDLTRESIRKIEAKALRKLRIRRINHYRARPKVRETDPEWLRIRALLKETLQSVLTEQ